MALDETRETFGIERCIGNRQRITEVCSAQTTAILVAMPPSRSQRCESEPRAL